MNLLVIKQSHMAYYLYYLYHLFTIMTPSDYIFKKIISFQTYLLSNQLS